MKRFVAQINDGSYVNINADRMVLEDNALRVYCGGELVAFLDVSCVLTAKMADRNENPSLVGLQEQEAI